MSNRMALPVLNADVITHILAFCPRSTLSSLARVSKDMHDLTVPILYRHLSLDLDTSARLIADISAESQTQAGSAPAQNHADSGNHRFQHTRSILIRPHHWGKCASHTSSIPLSSLQSLHFQIDRFTYHWPHGCPLLAALQPPPRVLIVSSSDDCDVLYWIFGSRCYERLPRGVERLVIRLIRRPQLKEWSLSGMIRDIKHVMDWEILIEYMADEEGIVLDNMAILALTRPKRLILRERLGESVDEVSRRGDGACTRMKARRERLLGLMRHFSKDQGLCDEDVGEAEACLEIQ